MILPRRRLEAAKRRLTELEAEAAEARKRMLYSARERRADPALRLAHEHIRELTVELYGRDERS
jgi:hypothetical protein